MSRSAMKIDASGSRGFMRKSKIDDRPAAAQRPDITVRSPGILCRPKLPIPPSKRPAIVAPQPGQNPPCARA